MNQNLNSQEWSSYPFNNKSWLAMHLHKDPMVSSDSPGLSNHNIRSLPNANYIVWHTNSICLCSSKSGIIIISRSCFPKLMAAKGSRKSNYSWGSRWGNQEPFKRPRIFPFLALASVFVLPGATTGAVTKSDNGCMQEWEATTTTKNKTRNQ